MKVRGGHFFGLMIEDFKNCRICLVEMAKNLVNSYYHILLYQPKGMDALC